MTDRTAAELAAEALREAIEVLVLSDPEGRRAARIHAPEDEEIGSLCERVGYGAVMDSAARLWRRKDAIGAHTTGAAALTVENTVARLNEALAALTAESARVQAGTARPATGDEAMSEQAQRQLAEALIDKVNRLEAENATLKQEREVTNQGLASIDSAMRNLTAERDRLRQALIRAREFLQNWDSGDPKGTDGWSYEEFRNEYLALGIALSPSETEEGG